MCRENARQLWFMNKNGEYFYVRSSSALSLCPFEKSLNSINYGVPRLWASGKRLRSRGSRQWLQGASGSHPPCQAPSRRLCVPLCAQGLDLLSWQVQTLRPTGFKRQKCHSSKWTNVLRLCAPENPVSRHLLGHRYFLPFSVLRYRLRSPPTSACATVRV